VTTVPNFQKDFVEYTIRISTKTQADGVETNKDVDCHGFSPIYATSPFVSRTHLLSNPHSDIKFDGNFLTVFKDQLSRSDPRFDEYAIFTTHVHSPEKVPGVVEAVYHELVEIPNSLGVSRVNGTMAIWKPYHQYSDIEGDVTRFQHAYISSSVAVSAHQLRSPSSGHQYRKYSVYAGRDNTRMPGKGLSTSSSISLVRGM
jgi:hypothetical protein